MHAKKPYISVIIDNYNYARFLADAINSVLEQDFTDYEIIVVDDASTDHSHQVIASYADKVKAIHLPRNSGQGAAFNAGFAASQGELICLLDADDTFMPDKLRRVYISAQNNPRATLIYHRAYTVDRSLKKMGITFPAKLWHGNIKKRVLRTNESIFPPTSQLSFRRSFLQQVLPVPAFLNKIDADFPLQMIAGLLGDIAVIPLPLSNYRVHGDNWFSSDEFARLDLLTLWQFTRRTEKAFHFINKKLKSMGLPYQLDKMKHRFHHRNVFIFSKSSMWKFLLFAITNPNFDDLRDRINYIRFGLDRRREYLELSKREDSLMYPWDSFNPDYTQEATPAYSE